MSLNALPSATTALPDWFATFLIPVSAISGVVFAMLLWWKVSQISVRGFSSRNGGREYLLEEEQGAESEVRDSISSYSNHITRVISSHRAVSLAPLVTARITVRM
jgi:hypothetical protein